MEYSLIFGAQPLSRHQPTIHRNFSSSDLRHVHGFRGGRFGLDAEQACEVFPEDQIQLIGIEARVFDDLADLETERQYRVVRS
jgi:hypothetical protein